MLNAKNIVQFDRYMSYQIDQKKSFKLIVSNSDRHLAFNNSNGHGMRYRKRLTDDEMKVLWVFGAIKKSTR